MFAIYERSTIGWALYVIFDSHGNHLGMNCSQFSWVTELIQITSCLYKQALSIINNK